MRNNIKSRLSFADEHFVLYDYSLGNLGPIVEDVNMTKIMDFVATKTPFIVLWRLVTGPRPSSVHTCAHMCTHVINHGWYVHH